MAPSRRDWLTAGATLIAAAAVPALRSASIADDATPLEVAYAGSMASLMEGPLKKAVVADLGVALRGHAQGSNALA